VVTWVPGRPGIKLYRDRIAAERMTAPPWSPADEIRWLQDSIAERRRTIDVMAAARHDGSAEVRKVMARAILAEQRELRAEIAELLAWEMGGHDDG
jgi:hypothetical protein